MSKFSAKLPFTRYIIAAVIINLIVIIFIFILKNFIPPEVPLLYGRPEGEEQLVSMAWLTIPQFISLGVIITNCLLAYIINEDFLKKVLVLFSLLVSAFSVITTLKIIFLVGSI